MKDAKTTHQSRLKLWDSSIDSRQKWIDAATGRFAKEFLEDRSCPVCDANSPLFMFNKEGGDYQKCQQCSMVYLSPVFKDEYLTQHYQSNHTVQSETVMSDLTFYEKIYNQGISMVLEQHSVSNVLDIGCSSGVFLDVCKKRGWDTFGIELNQEEALIASKKHHVFSCDLDDLEKNTQFELISMWDVFEHIKSGRDMLNSIKNRLVDNGLLFLQIPSSGSLAARIMQSKSNMFDGLEHVNLYNKETITLLAESVGFNVLGYQTVISEEAVINNFLNYEDAYQGSFSNKGSLFSEDYILDNDLGYKIQILLGKM